MDYKISGQFIQCYRKGAIKGSFNAIEILFFIELSFVFGAKSEELSVKIEGIALFCMKTDKSGGNQFMCINLCHGFIMGHFKWRLIEELAFWSYKLAKLIHSIFASLVNNLRYFSLN